MSWDFASEFALLKLLTVESQDLGGFVGLV